MSRRDDAPPGPLLLRIAGFPPVFLALLYFVLSYLYLSGFFFRASFAQGPWQGVAASLFAVAMMLLVYAALGRFLERREVTELALPPMARELALGALLGFALYAACILVLAALGIARLDGLGPALILLAGLAAPLATGAFEELLFRGGVFRLAERWFGSWIALALSSVLFGFAHLGNDAATLQGILSISTWAGILLAATYMLTRRLWLGIGLHAAWNYTQGAVFSGIVSGNEAPADGFVRTSLEGPGWLTGGSFGVEASLVALLICTGAGVAMLRAAIRRGHVVPAPWQHGG